MVATFISRISASGILRFNQDRPTLYHVLANSVLHVSKMTVSCLFGCHLVDKPVYKIHFCLKLRGGQKQKRGQKWQRGQNRKRGYDAEMEDDHPSTSTFVEEQNNTTPKMESTTTKSPMLNEPTGGRKVRATTYQYLNVVSKFNMSVAYCIHIL
jgi:hypothetical protein